VKLQAREGIGLIVGLQYCSASVVLLPSSTVAKFRFSHLETLLINLYASRDCGVLRNEWGCRVFSYYKWGRNWLGF